MAKRINTGIYSFEVAGKPFEVERYPDGTWIVFAIVPRLAGTPDEYAEREYWQDYATKALAIDATKRGVLGQ